MGERCRGWETGSGLGKLGCSQSPWAVGGGVVGCMARRLDDRTKGKGKGKGNGRAVARGKAKQGQALWPKVIVQVKHGALENETRARR